MEESPPDDEIVREWREANRFQSDADFGFAFGNYYEAMRSAPIPAAKAWRRSHREQVITRRQGRN